MTLAPKARFGSFFTGMVMPFWWPLSNPKPGIGRGLAE